MAVVIVGPSVVLMIVVNILTVGTGVVCRLIYGREQD